MTENEMTEKEAKRHLSRWLRNEDVKQERFTWIFTHTTFYGNPLFVEVVKALGGWIGEKKIYKAFPTNAQPNGRRITETTAAIPAAVRPLKGAKGAK